MALGPSPMLIGPRPRMTVCETFLPIHRQIRLDPSDRFTLGHSWPWLCKNSTRCNRTRNFGLCGHAESKKTQKFVFRSALRPNQISFSHDQDPLRTHHSKRSEVVRGRDRPPTRLAGARCPINQD